MKKFKILLQMLIRFGLGDSKKWELLQDSMHLHLSISIKAAPLDVGTLDAQNYLSG
jgi:hypothetical protein